MIGPTDCADEVARIVLVGAPETVVVDAEALGTGAVEAQVGGLLAALGSTVVHVDGDLLTVAPPSVAVLGRDRAPLPGCHAWYVGAGPAPAWMHTTEGAGPVTTRRILGLLGTSFAQERAGAAFRAAGARRPCPVRADYDAQAILAGITRAVAPPSAPVHRVESPGLDGEARSVLLRGAVSALERCCAPNGAIAAAPRSPHGGPDYWFHWQRDAAHVALALHAMVRVGPRELRAWARTRLDGYVRFVGTLGRAVAGHPAGAATSRFTMDGRPVVGYGDPQPDGPAASALAVLTIVDDPRRALAIAGPFLDHLVSRDLDEAAFDLWELTVGTSFHALNLGRRALRLAAAVATVAGDAAAPTYVAAAAAHAARLGAFRRSGAGGLVSGLGARPPWFEQTSRLDIAVIGSGLAAYDATDDLFNVDDSDVVRTMDGLADAYALRWPVNRAWRDGGSLGGGIGRFVEDCNDGFGSTGANPWPVATLWAAQHHLRRVQRRAHCASPDPAADAHDRAVAHAYLGFVVAHVDPTAMGEQIDGEDGSTRGARPLAWSHAEMITTLLALDATSPPGATS